MQAQAAGMGSGVAGGAGASSPLQDPKVQVGLAVAGGIAIVGITMMLLSTGGSASGTATPASPPPGSPPAQVAAGTPGISKSGGDTGDQVVGAPGGTTMAAPPTTGAAPTPGVTGGAAPMGTAGTAAGAAGAAAPVEVKRPKVRIPARKNPFDPNPELRAVLKSVPPPPALPELLSDRHALYQELNPPKLRDLDGAGDDTAGPPIPPMRVSGFIEGHTLSAILEIGGAAGRRILTVTPGMEFDYGGFKYKVHRLEPNRVILVNRWEIGRRSGVQRIEVDLTGAAQQPGMMAPGGAMMPPSGAMGPGMMMPGMPGMPGSRVPGAPGRGNRDLD